MRFTDKVVLVTGASRGIGRSIAMMYGQQGATVVGTSTSEAGAQALTDFFSEQSIKGLGVALDVSSLDSIKTLMLAMKESVGMPQILINNAGITNDNILLRMNEDQWQDVINTNLTGVYRLTKACVKSMFRAKAGRIINITSVVGVTGNPGQANYCASKAGVIGFTKAAAAEFAPFGITVNAVAPGFIETDMTSSLKEDVKQQLLETIPMRSLGSVQDIAQAVLFLTSDEAGYITGQTLHVNGGMCMV